MCEVRRNLEKYGVAYHSKFDRSVLKRRSISSDETDEDIKSKLSKAKRAIKSKVIHSRV